MAYPDDEVDLVIDAWARLHPDIDFTPLDVMSRLRRVSLHLHEIRGEAFGSVGLSTWEFDVLAALRRLPPPHEASPATLVSATMIGSAAMSARLENLEARGLVSRRPNPRDGRSNLASLTREGLVLVDSAMTALVEREAHELRALSREQQAQLATLLRLLGGPTLEG